MLPRTERTVSVLENTGNDLLKIKYYVKESNYWNIYIASSIFSCQQKEEVICYGTPTNDLIKLLDEEGYRLRIYSSVHEALQKAPKQAGVLLLSESYPREGVKLDTADQK